MESLTVVNEQDKVLGYSLKEDILRRGLNYRCVQVFIFNGKEELLVCRRPEVKKKFAGQFAASAMGHVRRGEEYEDSAIREMKQELGINVRLRKATKFSVMDGENRVFQEIWFGSVNEEIEPDETEIAESKYFELGNVRQAMAVNPENFAVPFIEAVKAFVKAKEEGLKFERGDDEEDEEQKGLTDF